MKHTRKARKEENQKRHDAADQSKHGIFPLSFARFCFSGVDQKTPFLSILRLILAQSRQHRDEKQQTRTSAGPHTRQQALRVREKSRFPDVVQLFVALTHLDGGFVLGNGGLQCADHVLLRERQRDGEGAVRERERQRERLHQESLSRQGVPSHECSPPHRAAVLAAV
jgi:hypothetical protein